MNFLILLVIFIIFSIVNMIFLFNKEKFKKLSIISYLITFIFAILAIISINISYNNQIENRLSNNNSRTYDYLSMVKSLNNDYIVISLVMFILFSLLIFILNKFKVRYKVIYELILGIQLIMHIYLFFFKCIIITKDNIDFSTLSNSLKWYYLNFAFIPLVFSKYIKDKKK